MVMAKTTDSLNMSFLLEHERQMILSVLQKDEKLRKREEKRIRKLKNELLELKRAGRRSSADQRECAVCLRALGLILQRGNVCTNCHRRICNFCTATPPDSNCKCTVCAKTAELKVVTGEWFLEERSKRFQHASITSCDEVKQSILSSPSDGGSAHRSSEMERLSTPQPERSATPQSQKSTGKNRKGKRAVAVESSGLPTVPNNMRAQMVKTPTQTEARNRCLCACMFIQPDGAESVSSIQSSDSVPEKMADGRRQTDCSTPSIAVSRASLSSDRSRSEVDLSNPCEGFSEDPLISRCHSVPGLNDVDSDEDIDAVLSAHYKTNRSICSAQSMTSINSMMSVYSETGDYGNVRVSGEILLNISYSYKTGALNVLVRECRCLATGDERRQRTDAYVKTYLLPDKSRQSKRKTSIKSNTTNPVFNENLRYVVSHSQLETRTLQVSVWHHDRFGHNNFLGEMELTFDSWEFDTQIEEWFALQPRNDSYVDSVMHYKGELTVVLKYIPAERNISLPLDQVQVKKGFLKGKKKTITLPKGGMVELLVKEAKNLTAVKGGSSDPFVKGYLLPDDKKSTKHKTAVVKRTVNPRWNHTFTYCGLQHSDLDSVCLELTVWDREPFASNVFLGGVRLGAGTGLSYGKEVDWNDAYGEEQRLWQRVIDNPEVPQECTLMLRSSMAKRKT
ncbi:synaptotagmin-like protein 5 isoform X1 [Onychostoma macrolepis]|uniref:synaptotagmin-like protein 5 isoform X1 n=1 Tax=Onychostoma macrolepis TaxID=369639 RepID=UPI00272A01F7|nr:synaptotagmin-like protein 5 isoform X1 [Onychostoma macrolepis]XP_058644160.1 synaptotagmin-like protein 5 isoform X1 [Onychostoma macrolepis]